MNLYTQASLTADALSLGPHWIYNQSKLDRLFPEGITAFTDPASKFHPNRKAGQHTHYGDQTVLLDHSIQKHGGFDQKGWCEDWLAFMGAYDGYIDGASKDTLASHGKTPSHSNDLAGASRIGPILDLGLPLEDTIAAARQQTGLTHGDPGVPDAAEFVVRAVFALRDGLEMDAALQKAVAAGAYTGLDAQGHLEKAWAADPKAFRDVGTEMGLTCHYPESFPLTLYFTLRPDATLPSALNDNGLTGGDNAARGMILALLFAARDETGAREWIQSFRTTQPGSNPISFAGPSGEISGVLEMPESEPKAYAIFAHCFTCGKDFLPETRITQGLAAKGIATLRIDFAGIGTSEGAFSDSSFITNLDDLLAAADWLRANHQAPELLVGHSLGGAAVLAAGGRIEDVKAIATIGAPADPDHVTHLFEGHIEEIEKEGQASVKLAGRNFVVGKRFLDDLETYRHEDALQALRGKEVLLLHAPEDEVVPLEDAGRIYSALKHPKSFVSLTGANHLLTRAADAEYVASLIEVWARRVFE